MSVWWHTVWLQALSCAHARHAQWTRTWTLLVAIRFNENSSLQATSCAQRMCSMVNNYIAVSSLLLSLAVCNIVKHCMIVSKFLRLHKVCIMCKNFNLHRACSSRSALVKTIWLQATSLAQTRCAVSWTTGFLSPTSCAQLMCAVLWMTAWLHATSCVYIMYNFIA